MRKCCLIYTKDFYCVNKVHNNLSNLTILLFQVFLIVVLIVVEAFLFLGTGNDARVYKHLRQLGKNWV